MAESTLEKTWLWHSTSWACLPIRCPPAPETKWKADPPLPSWGLMQAMQVHGVSQTHAEVTCGEPVWTQLLNPKHEPGVRSHGSSGAGYHLRSPSHTTGPLCG